MSNRIAAFRPAGRVSIATWPPRASRWQALRDAARQWLRGRSERGKLVAMPPRERQHLGLADIVEARRGVLDFEARRLGF